MPSGRAGREEESDWAASAPLQSQWKGTRIKTWHVISNHSHSHCEELGNPSVMRRTGISSQDLRVVDPLLSYPAAILGRERAIVVNLEFIKVIITAQEALLLNSDHPKFESFVKDLKSYVSNSSRTPQLETLPVTENHSPRPKKNVSKYGNPNLLPFEFRVLEFSLESTCHHFESETTVLEKEGYCALDELTSKIKPLNLERVRQIKSRLEKLSGHVKKVRDELEHLLDDDENMAEMYLTVKFVDQQVEETSTKDESNEVSFKDFELVNERVEGSKSKVARSFSLKSDTKELEFLLEAYFTQIDGILSKLSNLREYVKDTEDYINITLDDKQNLLLRVVLMLKIFVFIMAVAMVVVDTFGMLIHTKLFDAGQLQFLETVFGISFGCLVLCLIAIWLGRRRQLF